MCLFVWLFIYLFIDFLINCFIANSLRVSFFQSYLSSLQIWSCSIRLSLNVELYLFPLCCRLEANYSTRFKKEKPKFSCVQMWRREVWILMWVWTKIELTLPPSFTREWRPLVWTRRGERTRVWTSVIWREKRKRHHSTATPWKRCRLCKQEKKLKGR